MSTTRPASADTAVSSAFDASVSQEKGMSVGGGLKSEEKPEQKHVEGSVDETRILEALSKEHCTIHHVSDDGCYYIKSTKDDPTSPRNWPNWKRYALVILASTLNNIVRPSQQSFSLVMPVGIFAHSRSSYRRTSDS